MFDGTSIWRTLKWQHTDVSLLLSQVGAPPAAVATNTLDLDPPRKRKAAQPDDLISFNASLASIRPARFLDLENPWAKRRRLLDDLSLSSNMSLYPPPLLPPYYDLETPRAKRRRQEDAETTNLSLYSQTAVVPPFQYQDLDTSRQKRRRLEDAETLNLSLYPPSVATPFGYQDLESPARKRPRVSDTETLNLSLYPPPRLLQYVDLDTIRAKRRRLDDLARPR